MSEAAKSAVSCSVAAVAAANQLIISLCLVNALAAHSNHNHGSGYPNLAQCKDSVVGIHFSIGSHCVEQVYMGALRASEAEGVTGNLCVVY